MSRTMRAIIIATLSVFAAIVSAAGQSRSVAVLPDPYYLNESGLANFFDIPSRDQSKTSLGTQTINTGVQNCVLIAAGQSNMANTAPTPYTPTNGSSIDTLSIYDGAIYHAVDPLVGSSWATTPPPNGAHPAFRLGDSLVTNGKCSRVIIVPIGITSSAVADWATGTLAGRIPVVLRRLSQRGIFCGSTNISCVILWGQGETDCLVGTTQANYTAALNTTIANTAAAGFSGRLLVARQSWDGTATCSPIQAAQSAVVNGTTVFGGANADALLGNVCNGGNACRQVDGLHWSDDGSQAYATDATNGWQQALHSSGLPF